MPADRRRLIAGSGRFAARRAPAPRLATCRPARCRFLEASTLFGILVPGETGLLIGGVLAYDGALAPSWMLVAGSRVHWIAVGVGLGIAAVMTVVIARKHRARG